MSRSVRLKPTAALPASVRICLLAVLSAVLLPMSAVGAHSALQSADPPVDGVVEDDVDNLTLVFAQPVDVLSDSVGVTGPDGSTVAVGSTRLAADDVTVTVALPEGLPEGTATVAWRVIGADGHPIEGAYTITRTPAEAETAPAESRPAPTEADSAAPEPASATASASPVPAGSAPTAGPAAPADPVPAPTSGASPAPTDTIPTDVAPTSAAVAGAGDDGDGGQGGSPSGEPALPEVIQTAGRWLFFVGALVAMGVVVFGIAVHPNADPDRDVLNRVVAWAAAAALVGSTAQLAGHVAVIAGEGMGGMADREAWQIVADGGYASAITLRVGSALMLLVGVQGFPAWAVGRRDLVPMVLGVAGLLVSFQLTGHTATSQPSAVVRVADLLHVVAAATWTGGVVALGAVVASRRRRGMTSGTIAARFSTAAVGAVAVVGAAGTALALVELDGPAQLIGTGYGQVLLAKVAVVAGVVAVGAVNHRRVVPALEAGVEGAAVRLQRMVRVEAGLFLLAIALSALLVRLSP